MSNAPPRDMIALQQERLMYLYHATRCSNSDCCAHAPYCENIKKLLTHIAECSVGEECKTPHCVSSRYVLTHYQDCMDETCRLCASVRRDFATPVGGWQNDDQDRGDRLTLIRHIVNLLVKSNQNATPEQKMKVPGMAKKLEMELYKKALTREAYNDLSTLRERVQEIIKEVKK